MGGGTDKKTWRLRARARETETDRQTERKRTEKAKAKQKTLVFSAAEWRSQTDAMPGCTKRAGRAKQRNV